MTEYETVAEDLISAFVEAFNASDFEWIGQLVAPTAEIRGIVSDADDPLGVLDGLRLRSPWMALARGEVGHEAVAAVWSRIPAGGTRRLASSTSRRRPSASSGSN